MSDLTAILIPLIVTILGNLLVAWVEVRGKSTLTGKPKRILTWLLIVFSTLIVPSLIITWGIVQISSRLYANLQVDMSGFVFLIAFSVGTVGSLWPLGWGVLLYPFFDKVLDELYPIPDTVSKEHQEKAEPHQDKKEPL